MNEQETIDYEALFPLVLEKLFPSADDREQVIEILDAYGTKSFHCEIPRVRTAILKLSGGDIKASQRHTETACCDYRDTLAMAEYPKQSGRWSLKKRDPAKYQQLIQSDRQQYLSWIGEMTDNGQADSKTMMDG